MQQQMCLHSENYAVLRRDSRRVEALTSELKEHILKRIQNSYCQDMKASLGCHVAE